MPVHVRVPVLVSVHVVCMCERESKRKRIGRAGRKERYEWNEGEREICIQRLKRWTKTIHQRTPLSSACCNSSSNSSSNMSGEQAKSASFGSGEGLLLPPIRRSAASARILRRSFASPLDFRCSRSCWKRWEVRRRKI